MKIFLSIILMSLFMTVRAQEQLPYHQIPDYPTTLSSGNILSRLIDGLGYRYYWASANLRGEDLEYQPSENARSTLETLEHIHSLSVDILNVSQNLPNIRSNKREQFSYEELRSMTLKNLFKASLNFQQLTEKELEEYSIIFRGKNKESKYPIWHLINGQVSDAIYHTGQIVSFRRTTGNPMNSKVSVFMGRNRE